MAKTGLIHLGTSGWHYPHWRGPFYPEKLPAADFLRHYREKFHTVEINSSFYRLPQEKTLIHWRESTPPGFIFAVKASRYLTHQKKLKDPQEPLEHFWSGISLLQDKLGPVLFQLPPRWSFNAQRLQAFLAALPPACRSAWEFRDPSWLREEAYRILAQNAAALCIYDLAGFLSPLTITADFIYLRLHGPGGAYQGSYDARALGRWAEAMVTWASRGLEVFCYFDNDEAGYAPQNAWSLQQLLTP